MRKIHIGFIIDEFGVGGTENQLKLLIDGIDRSKFQVSLFLLRGDTKNLDFYGQTNVFFNNIRSILSYEGIRGLLALITLLKREKVDILQTFMQDATIVGVIAARMAYVKKVIVSIEDMQFWANSLTLTVHRMITLFASAIRVNSFAIKKNIEKRYFFKPIHVIHNGLQVNKCIVACISEKRRLEHELSIKTDIPLITLVSNCNREIKRVDVLIDAAAMVLKKMDACFLIVGDGHLRPGLEKKAENLGVKDFVKFMGQRKDVSEIYAASDIALNTSDSEGLSNSVLEGMGAGLPIIASDIPGNREVVQNNLTGFLFIPGDPEDLSKKIITLLSNRDLMHQMGGNACDTVLKEFCVENMVNGHESYYETLLKTGN
jgi:glycosyltransferase involved in cell wall biosynthesis